MTTLLFARHGQASFGKSNYDQLSELGIQQSQFLGKQYAESQRKIYAIYTGAMERQKDTASYFIESYRSNTATALEINEPSVIDTLNEFDHNDIFVKFNPEFATKAGILAAVSSAPVPKVRLSELFNEAMLRWHSGEHDDDYIESWTQFSERVQLALQQVISKAEAQQAKTVLIVTSGGVISAMASHLLQQSSATAYKINRTLINTGVTTVISKPDKVTLLSLNEHSHLYQNGERYVTYQ